MIKKTEQTTEELTANFDEVFRQSRSLWRAEMVPQRVGHKIQIVDPDGTISYIDMNDEQN